MIRSVPGIELRRQRLELPDGDFIDLDWAGEQAGERPLVVVLHGLEGSSRSGYASGLLRSVCARGWDGVVLHFRGCSGEPNRLRHSYCSGTTEDLDWFIDWLRRRQPRRRIVCVGYSLGGNALLKWLAERGSSVAVNAAVAVSVPFDLANAASRMRRGLSQRYQSHLLRSLRRNYRIKYRQRVDAPVPLAELENLTDFFSFDDKVTAPLHGYAGANDYYHRASCRQYLRAIRTPTLILHSTDDPFMTPSAVPAADELAESVILELSRRGGHVGFVSGHCPGRGRYFLEQRIPEFIAPFFSESAV